MFHGVRRLNCTALQIHTHNALILSRVSFISLLLRDADMHSAYLLRQRGWLGGWLADWLGVRHTLVLYQNGQTYLNTFSTIWWPHHSSFF